MKLLVIVMTMLFSVLALGQDTSGYVADWVPVDPVFVPPSWLENLILILNAVPVVGPYIVLVAKWAGVLSVALTALAGGLIVGLKALSAVLVQANLGEVAAKIEAAVSPVIYWLKYFSNFNAKK